MLLAEIDVAKKFRLKKNYRLSAEELAFFENTHRTCEEKQECFCPLIYPITYIFGMRSVKNVYDVYVLLHFFLFPSKYKISQSSNFNFRGVVLQF